MKFWCVQENVRKFLKPAPWLWAASERWAQLRTKPAEKALSWSGQVVTIKSVCVCVCVFDRGSPPHPSTDDVMHRSTPHSLKVCLGQLCCDLCGVYVELSWGHAGFGSCGDPRCSFLLCSFTLGGFYLLGYLGYSLGGVLPSNVDLQEVRALSKPSALSAWVVWKQSLLFHFCISTVLSLPVCLFFYEYRHRSWPLAVVLAVCSSAAFWLRWVEAKQYQLALVAASCLMSVLCVWAPTKQNKKMLRVDERHATKRPQGDSFPDRLQQLWGSRCAFSGRVLSCI